jgi:drug/metabolite transporter (DMT)-like permease
VRRERPAWWLFTAGIAVAVTAVLFLFDPDGGSDLLSTVLLISGIGVALSALFGKPRGH